MRTVLVLSVFTLALVAGYKNGDSGDGNIHILKVVEDVWLERSNRNYNYHEHLIIGRLRQYPLKRSLLRFGDLSKSTCPVNKIRWAKMYVYYLQAGIHIEALLRPRTP